MNESLTQWNKRITLEIKKTDTVTCIIICFGTIFLLEFALRNSKTCLIMSSIFYIYSVIYYKIRKKRIGDIL